MPRDKTIRINLNGSEKSLSIRILEVTTWVDGQFCYWLVNLTIENGIATVTGWAFVEPEYVELRFETWPTMEPPRFLSGIELEQSFDENSLAAIAETSEIYLNIIEEALKEFLRSCIFCVRSLVDLSDGIDRHQGVSFKYCSEIHPI
jgi:hypothetical protein